LDSNDFCVIDFFGKNGFVKKTYKKFLSSKVGDVKGVG
jgi:hypothetical protein